MSGAFLRFRKTLWPAFVIAVNETFLKEQPEAVQTTLRVINQQAAALMKDANVVSTIAERYGLEVDQVKQWFELTQWDVGVECPDAAIETAISYLQRLEIIDAADVSVDETWHSFE